MVFPQMEIKLLPRLERFDLDFDLPEHFLPEFPPAIFLTTRPDLGDVSQGKVVTVENFQEIFAGILNAKDLEGVRLLVTQFPQQQFNATADRKTEQADGHAGAWPASIATSTATRRGRRTWSATSGRRAHRRRIDTPSLRGVYIQRLFGSQRALKSIEDFTEFEQRAAYFDGDQVSASAKGINPLERGSQVHFMVRVPGTARLPAGARPGLGRQARPKKFAADSPEMQGQKLFFGKAHVPSCHPAPFYTDNLMHDLKVDRFYKTQTINGLVATSAGADQDVPAARHQGIAAVLPRRPAADAGGHGRVLQPDPGDAS